MAIVDVMRTARALLVVLVIKTQFAGADLSAHPMRALITTSTSTFDCTAELEACAADAECVACSEALNNTFESCVDSSSTSFTCSDLEDGICCASNDGCQDSAIYAEFIGCSYAALAGCEVDVTTCPGGAVSDETSTTDSTDGSTATDARDDTSTTTDSSSSTATATDDTTSSTTSVCQADLDACAEDEACSACLEEAAADSDAVESICRPPGYDSDTATCDERLEVGCCTVDEGPACMTSDTLIVAWRDCAWEALGCDFSFDCAAAADSSATAEGDDATSATASNGDDEAEVVDADDDDEDANDADAADTDSDSANSRAAVRGAATVFVAAVVSLVFMNA